MTIKTLLFAHLWLLCGSVYIFGQVAVQEMDAYNWFDGVTGVENLNLFEGTLTTEKYATLDGNHKYYSSQSPLKGSVIYDGETYFNVDMKYDINEDELLLPLRSNSTFLMLKLVKDRINSFEIDAHRFIKLRDVENAFGFYEVLLKTDLLTLLKKHKKIKYSRYKKKYVYYKFVDKNEYHLHFGGRYYRIKTKRDIPKIFPEYKRNLNLKSIDVLRKRDMDQYLVEVLKVVNNQSLSQKTP